MCIYTSFENTFNRKQSSLEFGFMDLVENSIANEHGPSCVASRGSVHFSASWGSLKFLNIEHKLK